MKITALASKIVQDVRASYWFIPTLMVFAAIALAFITEAMDHAGWSDVLPRRLRDTQADPARALLSVIAQSFIGVVGVMFSVTMVAVSFASSNFGPRLIGNFMRDRANQTSLGILIATFVYTILILRAVQDPSGEDASFVVEEFVPHLSILTAIVLALISVLTVIYYVHHIPEAINIANITSGLGNRLVAAIAHDRGVPSDSGSTWPEGLETQDIHAGGAGYVQTFSFATLDGVARDHDAWVEVLRMPGDFVDEKMPVLRVVGGPVLDDEMREKYRTCFALGEGRTENQNMMFMISQLCEIVARALSPGINDPFTAINCMNWLHVGLRLALDDPPDRMAGRFDRLSMPPITFGDLFREAHLTTRPYIAADQNAAVHVLGLLGELADRCAPGPRRSLIEAEFRATRDLALRLQPDPVSQAVLMDAVRDAWPDFDG
ncbi:DUF2254 domain-containing protein [Roseobacter sp. HKCCA0434]|uniref:DUF2254 domain-containing protein n=1 Tax=Roseobacter sp. HKCCA0434 TaxID=3079297 RepID=UPI002905D74C|nr:DUF2254 domain-containing protein [Roseobacter sp. HKCCA0434]